jgi:hypothetical protein
MTLRVQRRDECGLVILALIGRIEADQITDLEAVLSSESNRILVLDLKDVRLVDRDVVRFLANCEAKGIALRNCAAYIREWLSREKTAMPRERAELRERGE